MRFFFFLFHNQSRARATCFAKCTMSVACQLVALVTMWLICDQSVSFYYFIDFRATWRHGRWTKKGRRRRNNGWTRPKLRFSFLGNVMHAGTLLSQPNRSKIAFCKCWSNAVPDAEKINWFLILSLQIFTFSCKTMASYPHCDASICLCIVSQCRTMARKSMKTVISEVTKKRGTFEYSRAAA